MASTEQCIEVLKMRAKGASVTEISRRMTISKGRASQILSEASHMHPRMQFSGSALPDDWLLSNVPMPTRCATAMEAEGITTVGQLRGMTDQQLLQLPNFGRLSLRWLRHITAEPASTHNGPPEPRKATTPHPPLNEPAAREMLRNGIRQANDAVTWLTARGKW